MPSGEVSYERATVTPFDWRLAFEMDVPTNWQQMAVPDDQVDFADPGAFQAVAFFMAKFGAVVLTVSVRPAQGQDTGADWLRRACAQAGVQVSDPFEARVGGIAAVCAMGQQESEAGPMTIRVMMFARGGWLLNLLAMAPRDIWDAVAPTFDHMIGSVRMTEPAEATLPLWPEGFVPRQAPAFEPPAEAGGAAVDLAGSREAAEQFLDALKRRDDAAARAMLVPEQTETTNLPSAEDEGERDFELGQPRAEGADALVDAKLRMTEPGATEPEELSLPVVLRRQEGAWKIDWDASVGRMLGVNLQEVAEGLGSAMAQGLQALGEGLQTAFSGPDGEAPGEGEPAAPPVEHAQEDQGAYEGMYACDPRAMDAAVDHVRETFLPETEARIAQRLGKQIEIRVDWSSFGQSVQAVERFAQSVLVTLADVVQELTEYAEQQEKLKDAIDVVRVCNVERPEEQACSLRSGQMDLELCLADPPDGGEAPGPDFAYGQILKVLREAILFSDQQGDSSSTD